MSCAGNSHEICGGGNRILIYQDVLWALPTIASFANEDLQTLIDALMDLRTSILNYQAAVDDFRTFLLSGGQKRRRLEPADELADIEQKFNTIESKACTFQRILLPMCFLSDLP